MLGDWWNIHNKENMYPSLFVTILVFMEHTNFALLAFCMTFNTDKLKIVVNQIISKTFSNLSRIHWSEVDVIDKYFLFILKFEQYENANNTNFVCFKKNKITHCNYWCVYHAQNLHMINDTNKTFKDIMSYIVIKCWIILHTLQVRSCTQTT